MMKRCICGLVTALLIFASSSQVVYGITNGETDGNAHPYVGIAVFDVGGFPAWRCSGSLIAPTVFLTAGHCTDGTDAARVWFDETVEDVPDYPAGGDLAIEGTPNTQPGFCFDCGRGLPGTATNDLGIIELDEPVFLDSYAELPAAGFVVTLRPMTEVTLVGYGVSELLTGNGRPNWATGPKTRMTAPATLIRIVRATNKKFVKITANPGKGRGGSCFGDSGGPNLLRDTDTILSIGSFQANGKCRGVNYSYRIDTQSALDYIGGFLP